MQTVVKRVALCPLALVREGICSGDLLMPTPWFRRVVWRNLYSETGEWEKDYRVETRRKVEQWWHPRIKDQWRRTSKEEVGENRDVIYKANLPQVGMRAVSKVSKAKLYLM